MKSHDLRSRAPFLLSLVLSFLAGVEAFFTFDLTAEGMKVDYNATGLNTTYAIKPEVGFEYHIHVDAVPASGDCMATGLHFDPNNVGTAKPCDPTNLTTCQFGDLSGKYGNIMPTADGVIAPKSYVDKELLFAGPAATSILGRSVVIHNNGTRIACANLIVDGYVAPAPSASGSGSPATTTGSNPPKGTGNGAAKLVGSVALSGVVAFLMLAL